MFHLAYSQQENRSSSMDRFSCVVEHRLKKQLKGVVDGQDRR